MTLFCFNSLMTEFPIINQSIDLLCRSMDMFLYDRDLRHERVNFFKFYNYSKDLFDFSVALNLTYCCVKTFHRFGFES